MSIHTIAWCIVVAAIGFDIIIGRAIYKKVTA